MLKIVQLIRRLEARYRAQEFSSLRVLKYQKKPILKAFGDLSPGKLDVYQVNQYMADRRALGYAKKTIDNELGYLRAALNLAKKAGEIDHFCHIESFNVRHQNARKGFVELNTAKRIIKHLIPHWDIIHVMRWAYLTGWRRGEILGLTWDEVEPTRVRLDPRRSKNRHARLVFLDGNLAKIIQERERVRVGSVNLVFHRKGKLIRCFKYIWKNACWRAGVPDLKFHDLRRTFVRNMRLSGASENVTMRMSGHRDRAMFDRYDIIIEGDLREASKKFMETVSL